MSAGEFRTTKYQSDTGDIHQITIQPETSEATIGGTENSAPTEAVDSLFAAEVNRGARAYGLRPRKIRVAFTDTPPTGYRPYTSINLVVLQESVFTNAALEADVVFNGATGKLKGKIPESILPGEAALGGATGGTAPVVP